MCPYCRTNAPIVYRGIRAYCVACGRQRSVLSASSLNYAGQGRKAGGAALRVFGCGTLMAGLAFAVLTGLIFWAFFTATAGLIAGGSITAIAALTFWLINRSGRNLEKSGDQQLHRKREEAVYALAATTGGVVRPIQVAGALSITVEEADKFLTELAKQRPNDVGVEVTDEGEVLYTVARYLPRQASPWGMGASWDDALRARMRVAPQAAAEHPQARVSSSQPPPKVIDVELEAVAEQEQAEAEKQRAERKVG